MITYQRATHMYGGVIPSCGVGIYSFGWDGGQPVLQAVVHRGQIVVLGRDPKVEGDRGWQLIRVEPVEEFFDLAVLRKVLASLFGQQPPEGIRDEVLAVPTFFRRALAGAGLWRPVKCEVVPHG